MKSLPFWLTFTVSFLLFGGLHFVQIRYFDNDNEPIGKAIFNAFCYALFMGAWMSFAFKYVISKKNGK